MAAPLTRSEPEWIVESDCSLRDFQAQVTRATDLADYPHAVDVRSNVLVYAADAGADRRALQSELIRALTHGPPGVVVFEGAFDHGVLDRASAAFDDIIAAQHAAGGAVGDHFGKTGANDRIWNAAQKLALHAPEVFAQYYSADTLALVSQAWLGPRYQVTSQVNVVNPGGAAQVPHRDYHLGFVDADQLADYPAHLHRLSPALTLQAPSHTAICRWKAGRPCCCPTRRGSRPAISPSTARSSSTSSPPIRCSCRCTRGGRGVLQSSALSRCGPKCLGRYPPDGEPAADLVPRSGERWKRWIGPRW